MAKRKYNQRELSRSFNEDWECEFFVIKGKSNNVICVICRQSIAGFKRSNIKRHFEGNHTDFEKIYPLKSELRLQKLIDLKTELTTQQKFMMSSAQSTPSFTEASIKISEFLA